MIQLTEEAIDTLTAQVLRIHPEPFEYVTERVVHASLTADPAHYLAFLEEHLREIAAGRTTIELPPKAIFADGPRRGDFRVMPCVVRSSSGIMKTVKIVGTNVTHIEIPDQVTVGKALCLHPDDNYITHIFEACLLSSARTGACAAIAIKLLAPARRKVTFVGAGRVAYYVSLYASALGGVEELVFHDPQPERAENMASLVSRDLKGKVRCRAETGKRLQDTDVLVLATTSTQPICGPHDLRTGLVVSVGADTEEQRELESSWAQVADIYVDTLDSARVGDLSAWILEGATLGKNLVDLLTLVGKGPRKLDGRPRVFVSTGSALFDNLTITYILSQRKQAA